MARRHHVLIAAALLMAGCGGEASRPSRAQVGSDELRKAAAALRKETVRVRVTRTGNVAGLGSYAFDGTGVMRGDGSQARVEGELEDVDDERLDLEVRTRGEETWIASKPPRGLPEGARWIHNDDPQTLERALAPYFMAAVFEKTGDVDRVGEAKVDGQAAIHYRGVVPIDHLLDIPEVAADPRVQAVPVDLYVADGLPRRLRLDFDAGQTHMFVDAIVLGTSRSPPPAPPTSGVVEASQLRQG